MCHSLSEDMLFVQSIIYIISIDYMNDSYLNLHGFNHHLIPKLATPVAQRPRRMAMLLIELCLTLVDALTGIYQLTQLLHTATLTQEQCQPMILWQCSTPTAIDSSRLCSARW